MNMLQHNNDLKMLSDRKSKIMLLKKFIKSLESSVVRISSGSVFQIAGPQHGHKVSGVPVHLPAFTNIKAS